MNSPTRVGPAAAGRGPVWCATLLLVAAAAAGGRAAVAQDWATVPLIGHSDYQQLTYNSATGNWTGYTGGFPVRLRGVVLNDNEDWLDPAGAYDPGFTAWVLGAQAEFYVQAVDLDGTEWDPDASQPFDDFAGTACWMGQNYGNNTAFHPPDADAPELNSLYNYTDAQWYAELDRLGLWYEGKTPPEAIRAGDLIEIRARGGLYYKGKMNVNEQHSNLPAKDFEIVVLKQGFGLPEPAVLGLDDLKDAADQFLFDGTGQAGGEHYQSTLVKIEGVRFKDFDPATQWHAYADNEQSGFDLMLEDAAGRTLPVHLGRDPSFDTAPPPEGWFDVVGILDQADYAGTGGYRLMVMGADQIVAVPEPATLAMLAAGLLGLMLAGRGRRSTKSASEIARDFSI